jgi:hypothetical protein
MDPICEEHSFLQKLISVLNCFYRQGESFCALFGRNIRISLLFLYFSNHKEHEETGSENANIKRKYTETVMREC